MAVSCFSTCRHSLPSTKLGVDHLHGSGTASTEPCCAAPALYTNSLHAFQAPKVNARDTSRRCEGGGWVGGQGCRSWRPSCRQLYGLSQHTSSRAFVVCQVHTAGVSHLSRSRHSKHLCIASMPAQRLSDPDAATCALAARIYEAGRRHCGIPPQARTCRRASPLSPSGQCQHLYLLGSSIAHNLPMRSEALVGWPPYCCAQTTWLPAAPRASC